MSLFKKILPILGALDPTGIINMVRPQDIAAKTGVTELVVAKVMKALTEDPAFVKAKMDHEEVMIQVRASTLKGLDTGAEFSFWKGLMGSPRRYGVTVLTTVLAYLGVVAGTRAVFMVTAVSDAAGFADILKMLGGTLALLATAYVAKNFGKNS